MGFEIFGGRAAARNVTGGRDVIGRDRIAEQGQRARTLNRLHWFRLHLHSFEVRRIAHVGRFRVPSIEFAGRHFDGAPIGVARKYIAVAAAEHLRVDRGADRFSNFLR